MQQRPIDPECRRSHPDRADGTAVDGLLERPALLILPGVDNSGERHWQSYWETLPHASRVDFGDWTAPQLHLWVEALDRAIRDTPREIILVAHSLGCLAVAWWASLCWTPALQDKVKAAMLVAPPDVDAVGTERRLRDFRPVPQKRLPFPSMLVASRDDPYATFDRSRKIAAHWGSDLVDVGLTGHINAASGIGEWLSGLRLLAALAGENPHRLIAEVGLRRLLG